jgi:hypothetical protein
MPMRRFEQKILARLMPGLLACTLAGKASAQPPGQYRPALQIVNEGAWMAGSPDPLPRLVDLFSIQPSLAYRSADQRWRFSLSLSGLFAAGAQQNVRLRVREAYVGMEAAEFGLIAGKRILRWGVGYAFTATGVLDPPRVPTDPGDRLNLNEGRELAQLDWVHGAHAVTVVWAGAGLVQQHRPGMRETAALRYNALLAGFDLSLIAARDRGLPATVGANFTRVLGDAVELHGEAAWRERASFLFGGKYTRRGGFLIVAEYYTPGQSMNSIRRQVFEADQAARQSDALVARRGQYTFLMVSKSRLRELPGWKEWDLSASMVVNWNDRSRMIILDATRRIRNRFSLYGRAQVPAGDRTRSEYGMIPYTALLSTGFRVDL